jgi:hypothetical protein
MQAEDWSDAKADFGVTAVIAGHPQQMVFFDFPDAEIFGGEQVAGDKVITYEVKDFPPLTNNQAITIDGENWKIKGEPVRSDDGKWAQVGLKK